MNKIIFLSCFFVSTQAISQTISPPIASAPLVEEQGSDEVEAISTNGSITRAKCPYTCEMRGIPKQHCREWHSKMYTDKCYVQDLRIQSDAISFEKNSESEQK